MSNSSFCNKTMLIPGTSFHVDLAPLDALHPVHYSRRLLIFRCSSSDQRDAQLSALTIGLKALLSRCPILGGKIVPLPPDAAVSEQEDCRTIVPDRGIELVVSDLRTAVASLDELEATGFAPLRLPYDLLVPVPQDLGNDRPFAACKVQFSAIEGGIILTFAISHSVADGAGVDALMHVLSEASRHAQALPSEGVADEARSVPAIGLDRGILRNRTSDLPFNITDHPAFTLKTTLPAEAPPPERAPPHPFEATSPELPVLLRISAAGLAQLKADATTPGGPRISTHDALCALIWRSVLLIRSRRSRAPLASTVGKFFMPSDARHHLGLPPAYVGNAVYQLTAALDLETLLAPAPGSLQHAARAVRAAITAVTPALVCSYMAQLREEWVDWGFVGAWSSTGVAMGTGWNSGSVYTDDWGEVFGPLVRHRLPGEAYTNVILPKLPDGAAEVMVSVLPEEVEVLRGVECFGKYTGAS